MKYNFNKVTVYKSGESNRSYTNFDTPVGQIQISPQDKVRDIIKKTGGRHITFLTDNSTRQNRGSAEWKTAYEDSVGEEETLQDRLPMGYWGSDGVKLIHRMDKIVKSLKILKQRETKPGEKLKYAERIIENLGITGSGYWGPDSLERCWIGASFNKEPTSDERILSSLAFSHIERMIIQPHNEEKIASIMGFEKTKMPVTDITGIGIYS